MSGLMRVAEESVDYSKTLNGTTYTVGWILDSLRTNDFVYKEKFGSRKVKNILSSDISGGKGFVSVVLKCTVIFEDTVDEKDVYSTILKVPGFASLDENNSKGIDLIEVEKVKENITCYHGNECDFYDEICPFLKNLPIPKVFKTVKWILNQQEGCIHMEDLSLKGRVLEYFDSLNLAQTKNVVKHLAKMHKQFWTMDQDIWKGRFLESQTNIIEIIDAIDKSVDIMEEMAKDRFAPIIPLIRKYRKFCCSKDFIKYIFTQSYKDLGLDPVIVHGDMWTSNMIFSTNTDGDVENTVIGLIDWQLIHEGSPMEDIGRLFTITLDGDIRRQAESYLLQYYLEVLTSEFSTEGLEVSITLDQIQKAYDYMFMTQAVFPIFATVFVGRVLDGNPKLESINRAKMDKGILRSFHALEDLDRLLTGPYKHLFEKFGK